jgi:hypothetical protein
MDKKIPVGISAVLIASDILGNHNSLHAHASGPVFPMPVWGQQALYGGTSTSTSTSYRFR